MKADCSTTKAGMKQWVMVALSFGVPMGVFYSIQHGDWLEGMLTGGVAGVFFALAMGWFTGRKAKEFSTSVPDLDGENILFEGSANHFKGIEAVGGYLWLTAEALFFRSHKVNVQNHELRLALAEITSVDTAKTLGVVANGILVTLDSDEKEKFVVHGNKDWMDAILKAKGGEFMQGEDMYKRVAEKVGVPALQLLGTKRETLTFFGGRPQASAEFEWPRKDGRALGFIGQMDISELELSEAAPWLPLSGRLLFFYDLDEWPWGFDPKDKGGWAVIYDDGDLPLRSVDFPSDLKEGNQFSGVKFLEGASYVSIPSLERVSLEEVGVSEEEEDDYYDLTTEVFGSNPIHQVGGFPEPVQGDGMEEECQLVSADIYCGDSSERESEEAKEVLAQANDWKLLLQYDTDDDIDVMWGDVGKLYFWIRESDARDGNFDNVCMVLQCG